MAPRRVPASHKKPMAVRSRTSGPMAIRKARPGMAILKTNIPEDTTSPTKVKAAAKRRGTVFATFCKDFFAKNPGGHKRLQAAARAWGVLTPRKKAKYADRVVEQLDEALAVVPVPSSVSVESSGLFLPRAHAIQVGDYTVVQGQKAIGAGSYGQALEVQHSSGRRMAMKLFHDASLGQSELAAYKCIAQAIENTMLLEAACPFLRIHDFSMEPPLMWITLPLIPGGDLWKQLKCRTFGRGEAATIMHDAWVALQFLHEKAGVLHLDVKPHNMLWSGVKLTIIDFSLWERWPVLATSELQQIYCTEGFRPPELEQLTLRTQQQLRRVVGPAVDMWSLGVTGACLACSALAEPCHRPRMRSNEWSCPRILHRHLDRVAPVGTYLRPVLGRLLHLSPSRRILAGEAAELFENMQEQANAVTSKVAVIE